MVEIRIHSPVLQAIHERRSIRRYQDRPVERELIESILEAGSWSPSAHNRQPWRFVVLQDFAIKETLALAMGARLRRDLERDHLPEEIITKETSRSYERLTSAPVLIVLCLTMAQMDVYKDAKRNHNELVMAIQSVAMAGQNILLAAHELGLGACWTCAPLFCSDVVVETLDLPNDWQAQGIITLGYPAQERSKHRESLESRIVWR
jgi:coenzyme F420-0:L-glutamate ligase / coenzyme F420-1:gamma-L-glutamate ligase